MSTVREHLGLLWLLRRQLVATNPQYDQHWAMQASQFVGVHLDELIALAGGADIEDFAHKFFHEVPADFPANRPTTTSAPVRAIDLERLPEPLLAFDSWLNEPPWREVHEPTEVRNYRHEAYHRWRDALTTAIAAQSKEPKGAGNE